MATLRIDTRSPFYFAVWRGESGKQHTKSTKVRHTPLKKSEKRIQLEVRAQMVADAYEAADKEGSDHKYVRAVIEALSDDEPKKQVPSVRQWQDTWLLERVQQDIKSIQSDRKALRLLEEVLKGRFDESIAKVRKADAQAFANTNIARVSAGTVNRYFKSLSVFFNAAIEREFIQTNPMRGVKLPKNAAHDKITREPFNREDLKILLTKMPHDWQSMVLVSLHLGGQRLGDCTLLKWVDVDFIRKSVCIITQKTRRSHAIPMTGRLEAHLIARRDANPEDEYVHQDMAERCNRTGSTQHLSLEFAALVEALGLSKRLPMRAGERRSFRTKTFHSLRASAVTMLHDAGVPLSMAMLIVGHDNADIHRVYYRPSDDAIRASLANLDI